MGRLNLPLTTMLVLLMVAAAPADADTLLIHADTSDPAPKAAFDYVVQAFQAEHPDVEVSLQVYDHEAFKPAIRQFLMFDAPDVVTWYAGNRMRFFVDRGLFEDVSDIWTELDLHQSMAASRELMTVDAKQYGVPYTHYQWGIYYRKDIFEQYGLEIPANWDAFLALCQALKDQGLTPISIGTKPLWPAAGWFDYLNLRSNGLDFHQALTAGEVAYTDHRVRKVFDTWRPLLDNGYFIDDHAALSWQEALEPVIEGKAAMMLIGNFAMALLQEAGVAEDMGFFPFPVIDPGVARYEDAPTDTVHIPINAANKADARRFLAFIARPEIQFKLNEILGQLPANETAQQPPGRFLEAGYALLQEAEGLAQFYDRDATPEMAQIGMLAFRKFMEEPGRVDTILERLEIERRRIYEIRRLPEGS